MNELYRKVDALLEERAGYYPRQEEPAFGRLQAALRELAAELRARVGETEAAEPPRQLVASPLFVVGYYRSGTTLVQSLLTGHPDLIALPGESRHFTALRSQLARLPEPAMYAQLHDAWIQRIVSPDGLPPFWRLGRPWETGGEDLYLRFTARLRSFVSGRAEGQDLLGVVAAALAATHGARPRMWSEKTPRQESFVGEMLDAYPEARFLHVVRDPRTTIASVRDYNRSHVLVPFPAAAVELRRSMESAEDNARRLGSGRYHVIRYEDLVEDPEREMRALASHIDLPWSDELVSTGSTANSSRPERRVSGAVHSLSANAENALGRLPEAIVRAFDAEPARAFGYDMPQGSPWVALATRAYLSATVRGRALARALRPSRST